MTIPTTGLDETSPAGSQDINLGDNRIREYKTQVREVMEVDHTFPSSGQSADAGSHKKCSFIEQANLGTGAVGKTLLGSQTVSGKGELVYTDEDDNDVQITDAGGLSLNATTLGKIYPVGCIYTSTVATNPATVFGFGTWSAFGAGRVMVGLDSGDTDFDTVEETGGAKTHTLTIAEMPAHTHDVKKKDSGTLSNASDFASPDTSPNDNQGITESTGGGGAHNNVQPYIVVHFFKRTA